VDYKKRRNFMSQKPDKLPNIVTGISEVEEQPEDILIKKLDEKGE